MKIIFAQMNPGDKYAHTRHNLGGRVLQSYAEAKNLVWKNQPRFHAHTAQFQQDDQKVLLVLPDTYYNDTGLSARAIIDFYKVDPTKDFLVVHDDLALPIGTVRTRIKGSDAGNNGIKSLNASLGEYYARIRIGITGERQAAIGDIDYVLGSFSAPEQAILQTEVLPKARQLIDEFISNRLEATTR